MLFKMTMYKIVTGVIKEMTRDSVRTVFFLLHLLIGDMVKDI